MYCVGENDDGLRARKKDLQGRYRSVLNSPRSRSVREKCCAEEKTVLNVSKL